MLPMGTIMAVCMLLGVLFANRLPVLGVLQKLPRPVLQFIGSVVVLAGIWNTGWYAPRHLTEFWGMAALVSGILMIVTGVYLVNSKWLPDWLNAVRPLVVFALLVCGAYYAWTIYNL